MSSRNKGKLRYKREEQAPPLPGSRRWRDRVPLEGKALIHHLVVPVQSVTAQNDVGRDEQYNGKSEEQHAVVRPHVAQRILLRHGVAKKIGRDKGVNKRQAYIRLPRADVVVEVVEHRAK